MAVLLYLKFCIIAERFYKSEGSNSDDKSAKFIECIAAEAAVVREFSRKDALISDLADAKTSWNLEKYSFSSR